MIKSFNHGINLVYIIVILLLFTIVKCGLFLDDLMSFLQPPFDLKEETANTEQGKIKITFTAYNTEGKFTGYNIYMNKVSPDLIVEAHELSLQKKKIDRQIEGVFDSLANPHYHYAPFAYPALLIPRLYDANNIGLFVGSKKYVKVPYTISEGPNGQNLGNDFWFIAVSSVSDSIESDLSNMIQATAATQTSTGTTPAPQQPSPPNAITVTTTNTTTSGTTTTTTNQSNTTTTSTGGSGGGTTGGTGGASGNTSTTTTSVVIPSNNP